MHVLAPCFFLSLVLFLDAKSGSVGEVDGLHVSARHQLRPVSGFLLSDASVCKAYKICNGAPNKLSYQECRGGFRHSYKILGHGDKLANGTSVQDYIKGVAKTCGVTPSRPSLTSR